MRKATAFRGGANKTAPPCETLAIICYLATVPGEQLQRNISTKYILRNTDFQRPAKGDSTPAFACQHAAIAPLPCPNLQLVSQRQSSCELASFKTCNCSRKSLLRIQFAPQMWAARPHLANIFKKLLDQKTFIYLRLILGKPLSYDSARLGHIPSLPWESQLPLKPCISLQPFDLKDNCDSL